MKKYQVLIFIIIIFLILGVIAFLFPENGIKITEDFQLYFANYKKYFTAKETNKLDSIRFDTLSIDDIAIDSFDLEEVKKNLTPIEFPKKDTTILNAFFAKLNKISEIGKVRVLHYGDSQIEGDRITSLIRNKLQAKFGGNAIGLVSPITNYAQWSILQDASDNWLKFLGFCDIDTVVKHRKYGPMINFCRFTPVNNDTVWKRPEKITSAYIHYSKSKLGYSNTSIFKKVSVYYGNSNESCGIVIKSGGETLAKDSLLAGKDFYVYTYMSDKYLSDITIEFQGYDSPDIYGISLEDNYGITVDNIGLRGCSGDIFANQDANFLSKCFSHISADLFILQFGGNAIPNIKDKKGITNFCNYFKMHLRFLKQLNPNAAVIVIGPSDMSTKIKGEYVTYPLLEDFINEFKSACLACNACYWDCFQAMGGKNSMPYWVKAEPSLAAEDYTHFSPQGALLISNQFYNALILEYMKSTNKNAKKKKI